MTEYGSAAGTQHRGVEQLRDLEVGKRSTTSTTRSDLVTRFAIYNWYRSESRSLDLPTADWFFLDQILVIRIFRARKFLFSCCEPYTENSILPNSSELEEGVYIVWVEN